MRLVIAKNSESPSMTSHRVSTPTPRAYASSVWSISATPPPTTVELTLNTVRPVRCAPAAAAAAAKRAARSGPMMGVSRSGAIGRTNGT